MYSRARVSGTPTVGSGRTARRAPSRAALVSTCQVCHARPNSKMPTEMSSSIGIVIAASSSAAPRWDFTRFIMAISV